MLKPTFATAAILVVCSGLAQGHERRQCHTHLFEDGTPAAERHSEATPGCILQGNRMYVPSECYVPKPSTECAALMRRAADYQQAAERQRAAEARRWREQMRNQTEPGKGRIRRLFD